MTMKILKQKRIVILLLTTIICLNLIIENLINTPSLAQSTTTSDQQIMILIDNSGSIGDTGKKDASGKPILDIPTAKKWLTDIKTTVLNNYINNTAYDKIPIGLIEFGYDCKYNVLVKPGIGNRPQLSTELSGITPSQHLEYKTPIIKSVIEASKQLKMATNPIIVVYTDGGDNCDEFTDLCTGLKRIVEKILIPNLIKGLKLIPVGYKVKSSLSSKSSVPFEDCIESLENDPQTKGYIEITPITVSDPQQFPKVEVEINNIINNNPPPEEKSSCENNFLGKLWCFVKDFFIILGAIGGFIVGIVAWLTLRKQGNNP